MSSRKRPFRSRVKCTICNKEMDSDYQKKHIRLRHADGEKVVFTPVVDASQRRLSFSPASTSLTTPSPSHAPTSSKQPKTSEGGESVTSPASSDVSMGSSTTSGVQNLQSPAAAQLEPVVRQLWPEPTDQPTNMDLQPPSAQPDPVARQLMPDPVNQPTTSGAITAMRSTPAPTSGTGDRDAGEDPESSARQVPGQPEHPEVIDTAHRPYQPDLPHYNPQVFAGDKYPRDFNKGWYALHPWISYDKLNAQVVCFPCQRFMKDNTFSFKNWKKVERLNKHSRSNAHQLAMTKWLMSEANQKKQTSVLIQLDAAHKDAVRMNREYLRVILECLVFTASQNIAQRGHVEERLNVGEASDTNRGNFLELLHLRCRDIPWLASKLAIQHGQHAQWISPGIQNELLEIVAKLVREKIRDDVRTSEKFSVIADETSDITRVEQVSLCLRYLHEGKTKESFIGFHSTKTTEGLVLYHLVTSAIRELGLELTNIVGQCFDGASNMSGINKGLATRMKECSPQVLYVHCYGHVLNLAIQDTLSEVPVLRNTLGVLNSLYNFIGASTKRSAVFKDVEVGVGEIAANLKSLSQTRWACRWEAVKAVFGQLPRIVKALLQLADDRDPKTSTDAKGLLTSVCDFEFVFGLPVLKLILSNTSALSNYLQGKTVDVISAKRTADATTQTLSKCRSEESFLLLWTQAVDLGNSVRPLIEETAFDFKDAKLPRQRKPSRRQQALVGETPGTEAGPTTAQEHYRVNVLFAGLDNVVGEMQTRFSGDDCDVLCALGDVVLNTEPSEHSYQLVGKHYGIEEELLKAERSIFNNFVKGQGNPSFKNVAALAEFMTDGGLFSILPTLSLVVKILAVIPATSCSAERSFSALRRLKTYLRNTMEQRRLTNLAVICIEREITNRVMAQDLEQIMDIFGRRHNRSTYLF